MKTHGNERKNIYQVQADRFDLGQALHGPVQKLKYHAGNTLVGPLGAIETLDFVVLSHLALLNLGE